MAVLAVLASGAVGCSAAQADPSRWVEGSAAAPSSPAVEPTVSASPSPSGLLTLAFAGDVNFMERTAKLLGDPATAFAPVADILSEVDVAVLNLETAVTQRGSPEPKTYTFRAPATAFDALRAAGVDAVSLANNHALDYGRIGLADTLDNAERAGFRVFGAGRDRSSAYAPVLLETRGVRIAILGFSQIHDLADSWAPTDDRSGIAMAWDVERAAAAVTEARKHADLVIAFNHWGQERNPCPTADQKRFATRIAAAGADLIIGAHAHVLQGDGWLGHTYVAYGMGNFLWYSTSGSTDTGILRLSVQGRQVVSSEFVPAVVSGTGQPVPVKGAAAQRAVQRYAALRRCTGLADAPS
jgi:poly-gamma-glutamate synthesis protein (capsule biosynthesis protein)